MDADGNKVTEEDTFKALKAVSHSEMTDLWEGADHLDSPAAEDSDWNMNSPVPKDVEDFFNRYGWDYKKFLKVTYPYHPKWYKND